MRKAPREGQERRTAAYSTSAVARDPLDQNVTLTIDSIVWQNLANFAGALANLAESFAC
jgi:hypothetical protein